MKEPQPGWSLAWSDEFDGPRGSPADPAVWRPEVGGHGWGNEELQYYTDGTANAALDGAGNLAIVIRRLDPEPGGRAGGCGYTSARLTTKDRVAFSYGRTPPWSTGPSTDPATPAPTASPPPATPGSPSPTTSTGTRSAGNQHASAGTWTTGSTAR